MILPSHGENGAEIFLDCVSSECNILFNGLMYSRLMLILEKL
jgi:hypothetical protein